MEGKHISLISDMRSPDMKFAAKGLYIYPDIRKVIFLTRGFF